MERAYEQITPMGTLVVAYLESDRPFGDTNAEIAKSGLGIDQDFMTAVKEVHGFDASQPPPEDPPEMLGDWVDSRASDRRQGLAFCAPILPDAPEAARAFAKEAFERRRDEHGASRRELGITHETVMLNHTPMGDVICVYLEGDDPVQGNRQFAASRSPYDIWFKGECAKVFPPEVDFNQPVPPVTQIFDSQEILAS
jgi:hypothetical protein